MTSLAGPRLKLHRAGEHLDYLQPLMDEFTRNETNRIVVEFDAKTSCKTFKLDPQPVPPVWGLIIGDVLHNCRSSLDHLANRLVEANGKTPTRYTAWPIFLESSHYREKASPMIAGMSSPAEAIVEDSQPYKRLDRPEYDLLWLLKSLNDEDKHRQPHITVTSFEGAAHGDIDIVGVNFGPIEDSTEIAVVRVAGPEVNVPFHFILEIAFADIRVRSLGLKVYEFFVEVMEIIERIFSRCLNEGLISR